MVLCALISPLHAAAPDMIVVKDWATPNIFNTVALPIARTPYDAKWRHAWIGGRGSASTFQKGRVAAAAFSDLAIVQRDVNRRVSYRADATERGASDVWSTADTTLARGSGDCEDYAIAKAHRLLALGFRPQDLFLIIGNSRQLGRAHAILVVHFGGKFWVLDNLLSEVIAADQIRNFDPIITLSADRKWVHGFVRGAHQRLKNSGQIQSQNLPIARLSVVKAAQFAILRPRSSNR